MTNSINIIGLMSGTSVDGLTYVTSILIIMTLLNMKLLIVTTIDYDDNLKTKLKNIINWTMIKSIKLILKFGEFIGECINKFIKKNKLYKADLISSHGHTVFHKPEFNKTLQIGNGK